MNKKCQIIKIVNLDKLRKKKSNKNKKLRNKIKNSIKRKKNNCKLRNLPVRKNNINKN